MQCSIEDGSTSLRRSSSPCTTGVLVFVCFFDEALADHDNFALSGVTAD